MTLKSYKISLGKGTEKESQVLKQAGAQYMVKTHLNGYALHPAQMPLQLPLLLLCLLTWLCNHTSLTVCQNTKRTCTSRQALLTWVCLPGHALLSNTCRFFVFPFFQFLAQCYPSRSLLTGSPSFPCSIFSTVTIIF